MYDVDFVVGILVSWSSMMCGLLCSVCVSSWMPGMLELMHPVFQVTISSVWVGGWFVVSWIDGVS